MENVALKLPCLIVLVGHPGSGKTTWARRNGRGAVHVSQDGLIDAITPDGFNHLYRPIYREAEDAVARAALKPAIPSSSIAPIAPAPIANVGYESPERRPVPRSPW